MTDDEIINKIALGMADQLIRAEPIFRKIEETIMGEPSKLVIVASLMMAKAAAECAGVDDATLHDLLNVLNCTRESEGEA